MPYALANFAKYAIESRHADYFKLPIRNVNPENNY